MVEDTNPFETYAFPSKWVMFFPNCSGWTFQKIFEKRHHPVLGSSLRGLPWVTMNFRSIFVGYKLLVVFQPPFTICKRCAFVVKLGDFLPQGFWILGWKFQKYLSCHHQGNHGCLQNWNNKKTKKQTYTEIHLSKGRSCTKNGCFWEFLLDFQIHYRSMY